MLGLITEYSHISFNIYLRCFTKLLNNTCILCEILGNSGAGNCSEFGHRRASTSEYCRRQTTTMYQPPVAAHHEID